MTGQFAEAEAEAKRVGIDDRPSPRTEGVPSDDNGDDNDGDPAVVRAARDVKGVSASSGDTALEPLLTPPNRLRPAWQYATAVALLVLVLLLQVLHHNRQTLVLGSAIGPAMSKVYGWFGVTLTPRWDLTAYSVMQRGVDTEGDRVR